MTDDKASRVLLGRIVTVHGIRGDVVIDSYAADPADIGAYGPLRSADNAREFQLKVLRATPKGVVAHIKGIDDRTTAEALRGTELYVSRDKLPPADEGDFYHVDLIGLKAVSESGDSVGTVVAVQNFGAGDLIEVRLEGQQATEFIPFTDAYVPVVDVAQRRVVVVLPESTPDDDEDGAADESEPA
jgi:16S rRNA processing protein RimM